MDKTVVEKAKKYAEQRNVSLSRLVEFFFSSITGSVKEKDVPIAPITTTLSGMVKAKNIKEKEILADALVKKYL